MLCVNTKPTMWILSCRANTCIVANQRGFWNWQVSWSYSGLSVSRILTWVTATFEKLVICRILPDAVCGTSTQCANAERLSLACATSISQVYKLKAFWLTLTVVCVATLSRSRRSALSCRSCLQVGIVTSERFACWVGGAILKTKLCASYASEATTIVVVLIWHLA